MRLSVVIPIYNEEENIARLYQELKRILSGLKIDYEIIAVNDGSVDRSGQIIKEIALKDQCFKVIDFRGNFGQTAAISAGIDFSIGEIILPMDADLQNDPADIPNLLKEIDRGFDVVSGWRQNRQDKLLSRKIPSWLANWLISLITGLKLRDYGCTMKAYRSETIKGVRFYGEMHRFMPAYVYWHGAKIGELAVNHRPRIYGRTKYGISRTLRVILDLLTVKFLTKYSTRPMHFFGLAGFYSLLVSFIAGFLAVYLRVAGLRHFSATPLPLLTAIFFLLGIQFILMGIIAEILMRNSYEGQNKTTYKIKSKINLDDLK